MCYGLTVGDVRGVFERQVGSLGGQVTDTFEDEDLLLARAVLPCAGEARPRDFIKGGVALRLSDSDLSVHPYTLREVCKNGAIMVHSSQSVRVEVTARRVPCEVLDELAAAISECGSRAATIESIAAMSQSALDRALEMMTFVRTHPGWGEPVFRQVIARMAREGDRSRYGLMNAVTSLARDTADPRRRWELEELGGLIAAGLPTPPKVMPPRRALTCAR